MTFNFRENMIAAQEVRAASMARKARSGSLENGFKGSDNKRYQKLVNLRRKQQTRLQATVNQLISLYEVGEHDRATVIETEIRSGLNTIYEKIQPESLSCPPAEQAYYLIMTQTVADAGFEHLLPKRKGQNEIR